MRSQYPILEGDIYFFCCRATADDDSCMAAVGNVGVCNARAFVNNSSSEGVGDDNGERSGESKGLELNEGRKRSMSGVTKMPSG